MNHTSLSQLLTMKQVCQVLQCSRQTVLRLANSGKLKKLKIAGCLRFSADDVQQYINAQLNDGGLETRSTAQDS